jgi:hypothetical protein
MICRWRGKNDQEKRVKKKRVSNASSNQMNKVLGDEPKNSQFEYRYIVVCEQKLFIYKYITLFFSIILFREIIFYKLFACVLYLSQKILWYGVIVIDWNLPHSNVLYLFFNSYYIAKIYVYKSIYENI